MARPPGKARAGTKTRKRKRKIPNDDVSGGEEVTLDLPEVRSIDDPRKDDGGEGRSMTTKTGDSMSTRAGGTVTDKQEHGVKEPETSNEGKKLKRKGLSLFTNSTGDKNEEDPGQMSKEYERNPTRNKRRRVQFAGSYADSDYAPDESEDMDYDNTHFRRSKLNVNTKTSNNSQVRKAVPSTAVPDLMINDKPFISLKKIREMEVKERKAESEMKRKKKEEKRIARRRDKNKDKPMYACELCNFRNESLGAFYHHTEVNHGDEVLKLVLTRERKQQYVHEVKDEIELKVEKDSSTEENILGRVELDVEDNVDNEDEPDVEDEFENEDDPDVEDEVENEDVMDVEAEATRASNTQCKENELEDDSESVLDVSFECVTDEGASIELNKMTVEDKPVNTPASNADVFRCTLLKVPFKISEKELNNILKIDFPEHFDNADMICFIPVKKKDMSKTYAVITGAKGTLENLQRASIGKTFNRYNGRSYGYEFVPVSVCALCSKEFATAQRLFSHQRITHRGKRHPNGHYIPIKQNVEGFIKAEEIGLLQWPCQDCNCVYTKSRYLGHHVAVMHPDRQYKMIVNNKEIEPKIVNKTRHKVKCDICNVEFSCKNSLDRHIAKVHEGPRAKKILKRQIEMIDKRKPTYICDECSDFKSFNRMDQLRQHIAHVHDDLIPYNKNGVIVDEDTFKDAKKIECPYCKEKLKRCSMVKHIQRAHAENCTLYFDDNIITSSKIENRFKICPIKECRMKMTGGLRINGHLRSQHNSQLPMTLAPDFIVTPKSRLQKILAQDFIINKNLDIKYACPVCTFAINSKAAYYHHLEVNHYDILLKELAKRRRV